jgi:hypothetical protein
MRYEKMKDLLFYLDFAVDVAFVGGAVGQDADAVALEVGGQNWVFGEHEQTGINDGARSEEGGLAHFPIVEL